MLKALLASLAGAAALLLALTMSNPVAGFASPSSPFHPPSSSRSPAATALRMMARGDGGPGAADEGSTRRAAALQQLGAVGVAAWLGAGVGVVGGLPGPAQAAAKKITNLEEARALGEKKMAEIEKAKGPLIKVRDGVKYREELVGKGDTFQKGDLVKIRYQVYKGNGDYMFSTGYGREFQNDVGDTYDFTFGRANSIPKGAEVGMEGMRVGGKRKISVPPELGWGTSGGFPEPVTFGGKRKLLNHINEFLQFEVEVIRVKKRSKAPAVDAVVTSAADAGVADAEVAAAGAAAK